MSRDKRTSTISKEPKRQERIRKHGAGEPIGRRCPCWQFALMAMHGPFSFAGLSTEEWGGLLERMKEWERMTWDELAGRRDYAIEVASLSPEAQRRLQEIGMDDIDEVFSLHLDGRRRLIGIRDERVFRLLWWDPEHKACPSMKKHT